MTVFEATQEEEIKILSPLFLITYSWLQGLALYKPLDPHRWGSQFLRPTAFHSPQAKNKSHLSISSKFRLQFFIQLRWAEAKILAGNTHIYLTTNPSEECSRTGHALSEQLLSNFSSSRGGHAVLRAWGHCGPFAGEAFLLHPKLLSPRFDLVQVHKEAKLWASKLSPICLLQWRIPSHWSLYLRFCLE